MIQNSTGASEAELSYDLSPDETVTEGIVAAVSDFSGVDPIPTSSESTETQMEPLYHAVDTDALEQLLTQSSPEAGYSVEVSFDYMGYEVTVSNDGRVGITRPGLQTC